MNTNAIVTEPKKIRCTAKVRELLVELAVAMERSSNQTRILADRSISDVLAVETGAERQTTRAVIHGIAWRLHCASVRRNAARYEETVK